MQNSRFSFELLTQNGNARLGKIYTSRGNVNTPAFMTVGTQGTVKGVFTDYFVENEAKIILTNTYHLRLRPGIEIVKKFNGLHYFIN